MRYGVHTLFGLLLMIGIVRGTPQAPRPWLAALTAIALGCWYAYGVAAAAPVPNGSRARWWYGALLALWLAAVVQSREFGWLAFVLLLLVVPLFGWPSAILIATVVTGVVSVTQAQASGWGPGVILGPVVGGLVALGTAAGYRRVVAESEHRRRLVAELLAAQNDLVVVNEELAMAQRQQGVLAERARLAHDIHDTVAQGLSSIVLLARAAGVDPSRAPDLLRTIEQAAAENLAEARRVVHDLAPGELDQALLPQALGRLLERFRTETDVEAVLHVVGAPHPTAAAHDAALLRVAQSALANVRRHAAATRVDVTLGYEGGVSLDVVDDGRGFDPDALPVPSADGGFGLRAMAARLNGLGGTFHVESQVGEGTAVAARFEA